MKILHVDSGREWRGGQAQVLLLVSGLRERGHEQILCAPPGSPLLVRARDLGIDVRPLGIRGDLDAPACLDLAAAARRFRPAVLHAHTAHAHAVGVAAARLAGVPWRIVTRRTGFRVGGHVLSRAKYRSGVSRYIAISRHVADTLVAGGVDPDRISVVYSGVPPAGDAGPGDTEARRRARTRLGLADAEPVLALIGALTPEKGHGLALLALSRMDVSARLVFVGDGPEKARLLARASRLGLDDRVIFAGFREDLGSLWPAFDLIVAPSREEGLGTSVIEALGSGVPVVTSAAGGLAEIVGGGRGGRVVASEDPENWARTLDLLVRNSGERQHLAVLGRLRAREFTPDRMVRGTESVYLNRIPGRPAGNGNRDFTEVGS